MLAAPPVLRFVVIIVAKHGENHGCELSLRLARTVVGERARQPPVFGSSQNLI